MIFEHKDRILFAGDSVTDSGRSKNGPGEGLFDNLGKGYVRVIENMLSTFYPERYIRVSNVAIGGFTSHDLLISWDNLVLSLNTDWVSICIGVNDVWRQFDSPAIPTDQVMPDEYRANVEQMICSVKDKVKGVFLMSPYYMEPYEGDPMRKRMDEYGEICKELAEKYNCIFIDLQKTFNEYFKHHHSSYIAYDRVHPNQIGATIIAKEFLSHCDFDWYHQPQK